MGQGIFVLSIFSMWKRLVWPVLTGSKLPCRPRTIKQSTRPKRVKPASYISGGYVRTRMPWRTGRAHCPGPTANSFRILQRTD